MPTPELDREPSRELFLLADTLPLTVDDRGRGTPSRLSYLLLHGGAGPRSMAGLSALLAQTGRAVLPTHPGFDGRPRPAWCDRVGDLALAYLALVERLDLDGVIVVGNSLGGWIGAEMALRASPRVAALVLLNAVGVAPTRETGPIVDPTAVAPAERPALAFHDPARGAAAFAGADPAVAAANQAALRAYTASTGDAFMHDPTLRGRLSQLTLPTLVLWGASDGVVTPAYGRHFADGIPGAHFTLIPDAGHFPQIEQPEAVVAAMAGFLEGPRPGQSPGPVRPE